jgi:hypothetical protein
MHTQPNQETIMAKSYTDCAVLYAKRRKSNDWKRISHNQWLYYDAEADCYRHKHHRTYTVNIYPTYYQVNTGGWDTNTTWRKIWEFVRIQVGRPPTPNYLDSKMVYWHEDGVRKFTPFYDGIKVNYNGEPLAPTLPKYRRLKRGMCAEFYELAAKVRKALLPRILVGEFDDMRGSPLDDKDALTAMREIAARSEGLFAEFISATDPCMALLAVRPQMAFGRPRNWWGIEERKAPNGLMRLQSNINAARRAWLALHTNSDWYEIIEKEFK